MAPKRTTRRMRRLAELYPQTKKVIVADAMIMIDVAFKQGRFQDALEGLNIVKTIHNQNSDIQAELLIDNLIKCCREQME